MNWTSPAVLVASWSIKRVLSSEKPKYQNSRTLICTQRDRKFKMIATKMMILLQVRHNCLIWLWLGIWIPSRAMSCWARVKRSFRMSNRWPNRWLSWRMASITRRDMELRLLPCSRINCYICIKRGIWPRRPASQRQTFSTNNQIRHTY